MKSFTKLLLLSLTSLSFYTHAAKYYVIGINEKPNPAVLQYTKHYDTRKKAEDNRKARANPDDFKVITKGQIKQRSDAPQATFHAGAAGEHQAKKAIEKEKRLRKKQGGKSKGSSNKKPKGKSGTQHKRFKAKTKASKKKKK